MSYKIRLENGVKASKLDSILFTTLLVAVPDFNIIMMLVYA